MALAQAGLSRGLRKGKLKAGRAVLQPDPPRPKAASLWQPLRLWPGDLLRLPEVIWRCRKHFRSCLFPHCPFPRVTQPQMGDWELLLSSGWSRASEKGSDRAQMRCIRHLHCAGQFEGPFVFTWALLGPSVVLKAAHRYCPRPGPLRRVPVTRVLSPTPAPGQQALLGLWWKLSGPHYSGLLSYEAQFFRKAPAHGAPLVV